MSMQINPKSFVIEGKNKFDRDVGTVEISFRGKTQTVKAYIYEFNEEKIIYVLGFVGRYVSSTKDWPAIVAHKIGRDTANFSVSFGRDDRSGRFNKQDAIRYDPEVYATLVNPELTILV